MSSRPVVPIFPLFTMSNRTNGRIKNTAIKSNNARKKGNPADCKTQKTRPEISGEISVSKPDIRMSTGLEQGL